MNISGGNFDHYEGDFESVRAVGAWGIVATVTFSILALAACTAQTSNIGISVAPDAMANHLLELSRRAKAGDKQAQLDLGIAYEEGRGVEVDLRRAERLYRFAATDSGGAIIGIIPSSRRGGRSVIIPMNRGPRASGLKEAQERLLAVQEKRPATDDNCTQTTRFLSNRRHAKRYESSDKKASVSTPRTTEKIDLTKAC